MHVCLSVCPFLCCLPASLSVCLSIYRSLCLSVSLSLCLSVCLFVFCMPACLPASQNLPTFLTLSIDGCPLQPHETHTAPQVEEIEATAPWYVPTHDGGQQGGGSSK